MTLELGKWLEKRKFMNQWGTIFISIFRQLLTLESFSFSSLEVSRLLGN
jgi:hypothetical protein